MEQKPPKNGPPKPEEIRAARLKSALKANLARRKAQARARADLGSAGRVGGQKKEG